MQKMNKDIAICIFTYKEPILLRKCIQSISKQNLQNFDLFIIDNDKEESAERVVRFINYTSNIQIKYYNEFKNNTINNPFELIKDNYKYLAVIDDNRIADINWLKSLHSIIIQNNEDIVFGYIDSKKNNQIDNSIATNVIFNIKIFTEYKNELLENFNNKTLSKCFLATKNNYKITHSNKSKIYLSHNFRQSKLKLKFKMFYSVGNSKFFMLKNGKKYYKILKNTLSSSFKILSSIIIFFPNLILFLFGHKKKFNKLIKRFSKSIGFIFGLFGHKFGDFK